MKKLLISVAVATLIPSMAMASEDSLVGGTAFTGTFTTTDGNFVSDGFSLTLSDSVQVGYVESTTAIGVEAAHPKGTKDADDATNTYGGSSAGGTIDTCSEDLTADGCTTASS